MTVSKRNHAKINKLRKEVETVIEFDTVSISES